MNNFYSHVSQENDDNEKCDQIFFSCETGDLYYLVFNFDYIHLYMFATLSAN